MIIESLIITVLPVLFLIVLFNTGAKFRHRNIDMDGKPPIDRTFFYSSKYSIILVWAVMSLRSWGIIIPIELSHALKWLAMYLWVSGFTLLFIGRFGLGDSFRIGTPGETTGLRTGGLFRLSRNPMYVGVYTTLLASFLYTMNPLIFCIAVFIVVVHHKIVLAEEHYLSDVFGEAYRQYCGCVRRYL